MYSFAFVSPGFTPMDSTNHNSKTVFLVHGWESMGAENQLYALFYVILYKGLEYLQILIFVWRGSQNYSPVDTEGLLELSFGAIISYTQILIAHVAVPLTFGLFKGQLYLYHPEILPFFLVKQSVFPISFLNTQSSQGRDKTLSSKS